MKDVYILAVESSCDETSVAVLKDKSSSFRKYYNSNK